MSVHDIDMDAARSAEALRVLGNDIVMKLARHNCAMRRDELMSWFLEVHPGDRGRFAFFRVLDAVVAAGRVRAYVEACQRWVALTEGFSVDPNTTLERIKSIAANIRGSDDGDAELARLAGDLADAVQDLDDWLARGGFLPDAWTKGRA